MIDPLVLQSVDVEWTRAASLQLLGLGLAAGVAATGLAVGYRRVTTRAVPDGAAPFLGVLTVGCWLLGDAIVRGSLVGTTALTDEATATYVLAAAAVGGLAGTAGGRLGDRFATDVYGIDRIDAAGPQAERLRDARLVVSLELPSEIETASGYGPVPEPVERSLANAAVRLPSALPDDAIADRIERRVATDHDVDHVRVALGETGDVDAIAVGRERRGVGPEIPPGTVAVAVRADPAADASSGDPIELWSADPADAALVARGRLHSRDGDVATVVVPEDAVGDVSPLARYRLVTPADAPTDRGRFLALVRSAPETTISLDVTAGGPLEGEFVGWLPGVVLAVRRGDSVLPFPADNETLQPGDVAFCLGRPGAFAAHDAIGATDGAEMDAEHTVAAEEDGDPVRAEATD